MDWTGSRRRYLHDEYNDLKAEVVYRIFYYNNDVYLLLHIELCLVNIIKIQYFPRKLWFSISSYYHCEVACLQEWFIQIWTLHKCVLPAIWHIYMKNIRMSYFTDKTTAFSSEEKSRQISMIVHEDTSPINICGELYCMRWFSLLLLHITVICLCVLVLLDGGNKTFWVGSSWVT